MNTIRIQRDGTLVSEGAGAPADPLPCLNCAVVLAEDFSLRSYFSVLEAYPDLLRINPFFPVYLEQYRACDREGCRTEDFDRLVFRKTVEMIGFPGNPRLEIFTSLKGDGAEGEVNIHSYSLQQLLDLPLGLGKLKHVIFGDTVDVFEFETQFTFFELVDGIAWELSFQNLPQKCEIRR